MLYLNQPPAPILRPWVRSIWYCRAPGIPHARERVLPNGCIQIVLNLSRDFLTDCGTDGAGHARFAPAIAVGPSPRCAFVDTADMEELAGIVIRPGGFSVLFGERADLLYQRSIALDDLCRTRRLIEALREAPSPAQKIATLNSFLRRLLGPVTHRSGTVDRAIDLFRRSASVAQCARSIGISERRLSQVFREEVGVAPKLWCRLRRFQTAAHAIHQGVDIPWADLALDCGYYDQSHFANDFRAFSGIDPTTYSLRRGVWQNHVPVR